jgi:hypothetical protein
LRASFFLEVTDALAAAHDRHVVHPYRGDQDEAVKALDFGIAKLTEIAPVIEEGMRLFGLSAQDIDAALTSLRSRVTQPPHAMANNYDSCACVARRAQWAWEYDTRVRARL